jgi:hypothetical protein
MACPLWVRSRRLRSTKACPLCSQKRISAKRDVRFAFPDTWGGLVVRLSAGCAHGHSDYEMARRRSTTSIINLLQSMHSNVRLSPSEPAASISKSHIRESQLSHFGSSNRRSCGISLRVRMTSPLRAHLPATARLPGEYRWSNHVHVILRASFPKNVI